MRQFTAPTIRLGDLFETTLLTKHGWRRDHVQRFRGDYLQFYRHPEMRGAHSLASAVMATIERHADIVLC